MAALGQFGTGHHGVRLDAETDFVLLKDGSVRFNPGKLNPDIVRAALATHNKFKPFAGVPAERLARFYPNVR